MQAAWQQGQYAIGEVNHWFATSARLAPAQKLQRRESCLLRLSWHESEVTGQWQQQVEQGLSWGLSKPRFQ